MTSEYQGSVKRLEPTGENTIYSASARGPRRGDSLLKPDLAAPGVTVYSALNHSGHAGHALSGTSMATPHVAGMMALLRQLHPDWPAADLKALAMNTATIDMASGALRYDPGRAGAGRVVLTSAVSSSVIAYNASEPYLVSVSLARSKRLTRLPLRARSVSSIRAHRRQPTNRLQRVRWFPAIVCDHTDFRRLPPRRQNHFGSRCKSMLPGWHTRAPTVPGGGRTWLSEASGYVVLAPRLLHEIYLPVILKGSTPSSISRQAAQSVPAGWPLLRVPVYAVVRPAAQMQAAQTMLNFTTVTTTTVSLMGQGLNTGPAYPTDTLSLVSAFELAEANLNDPGKLDRAELKYLGAGNNFGATGWVTATTLFFAIATQGNWSVPCRLMCSLKLSMPIAMARMILVFAMTERQANDVSAD
jgi:hypothetical protein